MAGNENSFAELYEQYARKLFPFLIRLTNSNNAADDIIQDTFLSVWLNRHQLPEILNFQQWIYRIAANKASTWIARGKLIARTELAAVNHSDEDATIRQVLYNDTARLIHKAVKELSPQRRRIYELYREGMDYNEIALVLKISPSTVRTAVSISLDHIRKHLEQAGLPLLLFFLK